MKSIFYIAIGIILLSSCRSYQYTQLSSDLKQTTESHHYYINNDSVYIDFDFSGSNFPISIFILNVGSKDLYLDLSRTVFLENDVIVSSASLPKQRNDSLETDSIGVNSSNPNKVLIPSGENIKLFYRAYSLAYNKNIRKKSKRELYEKYDKKYILKYHVIPESMAPLYEIAFTFGNSLDFKNGWTESAFFRPSVVFTSLESPKSFPIKNPNVTYSSIYTGYGNTSMTVFVIALSASVVLLSDYDE